MSVDQNEVSTGIGLRQVRVALRDTDGTIKIPSGTPHDEAYAGLQVGGALGLTLAVPEPQRITARGDDRAYYTFILPPTEVPTGQLTVSKINIDVIALLTGTKTFGSGTTKKIAFATDEQGDEPEIVLWGMQRGIDSEAGSSTFGQKVWRTYILLNGLATVQPSPMQDATVSQFVYSLVANDSTVDENGHTFTAADEGFTAASFILVVSLGKYILDAFEGDGVHRSFNLSQTPRTSAIITVYEDGVKATVTTDYTVTAGVLEFVGGNIPTDGSKILVEYEYD